MNGVKVLVDAQGVGDACEERHLYEPIGVSGETGLFLLALSP